MKRGQRGYNVVPLSPVQKGAIGQFAFLALALATGKGEVEVYAPVIDNEGRDAEVRRHLRSRPGISIQIKVAFSLSLRPNGGRYLIIRFRLPEARLQNDPRLWYFFAFYDAKELGFANVGFVIPAHIFHRMARCGGRTGDVYFEFEASLDPRSRDRWSPYRIAMKDLGKRLLQIIDDTPLTATMMY